MVPSSNDSDGRGFSSNAIERVRVERGSPSLFEPLRAAARRALARSLDEVLRAAIFAHNAALAALDEAHDSFDALTDRVEQNASASATPTWTGGADDDGGGRGLLTATPPALSRRAARAAREGALMAREECLGRLQRVWERERAVETLRRDHAAHELASKNGGGAVAAALKAKKGASLGLLRAAEPGGVLGGAYKVIGALHAAEQERTARAAAEKASDTDTCCCVDYAPVRWVASWFQWAAGDKVYVPHKHPSRPSSRSESARRARSRRRPRRT